MSEIVIEIENLYKEYRLGLIGYGTLREDVQSWWARMRGREDPNSILFSKSKSRRVKSTDHILALKDINLTVERGERLGIIGKNGAGKTTLLKMLARIASPTNGTARIKGRLASLIAVGTGFHKELTGRENIYLNGSILGLRKFEIDQRFDEIVDFAGVEQFIDTPVKRYSSGMYVRLGFAVAAHLDPDVLIVDEVLAVGDAEFRKKALGKMKDVSEFEGRTILFVSHNMLAIQSLCNRTMLLESGVVTHLGETKQVIEEYLTIGKNDKGELVWDSPDDAPGDNRARLKAVRVFVNGSSSGIVNISEPLEIIIDYWNLIDDARLYVSIHIYNSLGVCVFVTGNVPAWCINPDPWFHKCYPKGLFRSSCTIPGDFLNTGDHSIGVFINPPIIPDPMISEREVLSFSVTESGENRKEHHFEWPGAVRCKFEWETNQINS